MLYDQLAARDISLQIVGARGRARDLLRADGLAEKVADGSAPHPSTTQSVLPASASPRHKLVFCTVLAE